MGLIPDLTATCDDGEGLEVPPNATSLDFLQAVYRSPAQPMHRRLKAAVETAQYEQPRLAVMAQVNGEDFARALDRAMQRSAKVISQPKALEHHPSGRRL